MPSKPMKSPTSSSSSSRPRRLRDFLQQKYERIPKTRRHAMLAATCLLWFLVVGAVSGVASLRHGPDNPGPNRQAPSTSGTPPSFPGNLSTSMVLSIMARHQGIMKDTTEPGAALEAGVIQKALTAHNAYHGAHPEIQAYIDNSTASAAKLMTDEATDLTKWPLDRLSTGNAMLRDATANPTIATALAALRNTVHLNNINDEFGLWYWQEYPHWSVLDGLYSLGPFVALDFRQGTAGADTANNNGHNATVTLADKVALQFHLLWNHCYNATGTGLLVHGYDASRSAPWAAGRATGASGVVWGRGLGWFMMALVDTLELLAPRGWDNDDNDNNNVPPPPRSHFDDLVGMYKQLAPAVLKHADAGSGGWFQVVDMAGRGGNYVESSATAMLAYALLKGARLGYLDAGGGDAEAARAAGRAAHAFLVGNFVTTADDEDEDGVQVLQWGGTVAVCSLNSTATYEYYVGRPVVPNSPLGAAAFVLASVEVERLDGAEGILR